MKRALATLLLSGCWSVGGQFVCNSSDQCNAGGRAGQCAQQNCAYPDQTCGPGGLRWDDLADPSRANQCVPLTSSFDLSTGDGPMDIGCECVDIGPSFDLIDATMPYDLSDGAMPLDFTMLDMSDGAMPLDFTMLDMTDAATPLDFSVDAAKPLDFTVPFDMTDAATPLDMSVPCTRPWLLVAIYDLQNNGTPGQIARYSIAANGKLSLCDITDFNGVLDELPMTMAVIPNGAGNTLLAVGTRQKGLQVFDYDLQLQVASYNSFAFDNQPIDVFPLKNPNTGDQLVAFAAGQVTGFGQAITHVYAFKGSTLVKHWDENTDLLLSTCFGMTASPNGPNTFFATKLSTQDWAAVDVAPPWTTGVNQTNYLLNSSSDQLWSIYSILVGSTKRTAWTSNNNGIYYSDDSTGSPSLIGPLKCTGSGVPMPCTLSHSVPDPSANATVLGICDYNTTSAWRQRYVVRMVPGANGCSVLLDGGKLLPIDDKRYQRLAIVQ